MRFESGIYQARYGACSLSAPYRVRAIRRRLYADALNPAVYRPAILAGGYVGPHVKSTREEMSGADDPGVLVTRLQRSLSIAP